ncbi:hypothetical protein [Phytohabitans aurantiacus]|nr:hypothetical protein [Phytohabitans aurantiacus]
MKPKELSFSIFGLGAKWEFGRANKEIARRTVRFLEDRRLLFGQRGQHPNDPQYCVRSAQEIRQFLGEQLEEHDPGRKLARALQEMRAACRRFIDVASEDPQSFRADAPGFFVAVGELRSTFGFYIGALADRYNLDVDDDLRQILPPSAEEEPQDAGLATLLDGTGR